MKAIPLRYVAQIKPDKVDEMSSGGLYLPESSRAREQISIDRGTLVSHGEGFWDNQPGRKPKVGESVLFDRYAGSLIKIDGQDYRLCNDDKVIAILED